LRLSKASLLVIIAGFFIIASASLGVVYFQRVNEQNELNEQLVSARSRLNEIQLEQLSSQQTELNKQLNQTTSQREAVKAILSEPLGSITVNSILFDIAEAYGLEITVVTSPGLATENLEGIICSSITLNATVEGDVGDLVNFVTKLNSRLASGIVESITITVPEAAGAGEASADIQLVVYTYYGD